MSDDERTVYAFPKGSSGEIRATLSTYKGHDLASIRFFVRGKDDETAFFPTAKGVSVHVDQLPRLLEAVQALCSAAGREGGVTEPS